MKTTIQISDSLRRRLKGMSSYRGISYSELLEDMVSLFESNVPFESEEEFKEWFKENLEKFSFKEILEERETSSPDFKLKNENDDVLEVEIELVGEDFVRHGHNPEKTDMIVCMFSEKDEIEGIPVLSVIKPPEEQEEVIREMDMGFTSLSIPVPLFESVKEMIEDTGFNSVSSYTAYVLRQIIIQAQEKEEVPYTDEDVEKIRDKLKALGYL